ncbi:hypothetical protein BGZ98_000715 [Dissophora globulifera]|nr:hypothetical protein BGZ98_000715 [Dissophora globulifera]
MERSKDSAVQRAFQSLPRNLRRRAASHNLKRLPVRLRQRAMKEVEADPVKKGKKPDNRHKKRRPGTISQEYLRRQMTTRWLETHIWHAKRMKMVEAWGYKLAEHSNEHGIKSAYKSSHHQCIVQDSSYFGCLEITGVKKHIVDVFQHMLDLTAPTLGSARNISGKRQFTVQLYEYDGFPYRLIAPATFLWRQDPTVDDGMDVDEASKDGQLWIWVHPSTFEVAKAQIQESVAKAGMVNHIVIKDLENSLAMFDFTGPRSTALLQAVLKPCTSGTTAASYQEARQAWETIASLRTSSSLPPGVVLGLLVDDPRLTFPHKAAPRPTSIPASDAKALQDLTTRWPTTVARSSIWSSQERELLATTIVTEAKLNDRRAQNLVPGTRLKPIEGIDAQIPILLIQREGQPQTERAPSGGSSEFECGWTLVLPKGWAMPFWKSMIFAGARPGGLRERRSFHFETRQSCFPYDYPGTVAYRTFAEAYGKEAEAKYDRKPVAKRINYAKFGVQDPFAAAWIKALKAGVKMLDGGESAGAEAGASVDEDKVWLLQTPKLVTALTDAAILAAGGVSAQEMASKLTIASLNLTLAECLQGLAAARLSSLSLPKHIQLVSSEPPRVEEALVRVGVDFLNRGKISMNGMIYAIPERHYKEWATRVQLRGKRTLEGKPRWEAVKNKKKSGGEKKTRSWVDSDSDEDAMDEDELDGDELETAIPSPDTLLGYITTGQYCYSEGKSYGIGCCSATGLARLIELETGQRAALRRDAVGTPPKVPTMMVLVRNIRSKVSRPAKLSILA